MGSKTWIAALAAVVLLQGVGLAAAEGVQTVKVGVNGVISDAPIFIANERGYFKDEGIAVSFVHFSAGPKMVAPLGTGELDVAAGASSAGLFNAVARGITIKIVADKGSTPPGPSYMPLIVRKDLVDDGWVKTFADLKGLKIGVAGKGGSPESTLNEILKKGGLTMSDITLMQSIGYPEQVVALQHKGIDASITTEPSVSKAVENGIAVRFSDGSAYPDQEVAMLLYSGDFATKHRALAEKFMVAYVRGVRAFDDAVVDGHFTGKDAPEVVDTVIRNGTFKDKALFAKMAVNGCNPDGRVNVASLRKDLAFFKARGYIEGKVTVDDVVDNSFVEKAVATLGPYRRAE